MDIRKFSAAYWKIMLCSVFVRAGCADAQESELFRTQQAPLIDGSLNETVWQGAQVFTEFKTMHPTPGQDPSERTEVRLRYHEKEIFIGVQCFDSQPDLIRTGTAGKENPAEDDWVAFALDTFNDHLNAYFFLVTAGGEKTDGTLNSDGSPGLTYNAQWQAAAQRNDRGYTVEMAIPWRNLAYEDGAKLTMSFKVARLISRKSEEVDFPQILPDRGIHLAQFRRFTVKDIDKNHGSPLAPIVDVHHRYLQKQELSALHDTGTLEGRCAAWGDAAVTDYLLFPGHELHPAEKPFLFEKKPQEARVRSVFNTLEYSDNNLVGDLDRFLNRTQTAAFIVIQNDTIVYEKYFNGFGRDSVCTSFSVAKSFASALVGIAIDDGKIGSVEDPATDFIPELLQRDKRFKEIRMRHLLQMASGLRYIEDDEVYRDDERTYYDPDLRNAALEKTEITDNPGERFLYNNYNPLLIGMILERATGKSVTEYLQEKIWDQVGMEYGGSWSTDSEKNGFEKMESGLNARAIDFAKFGRLFLNDGRFKNRRIISAKWVNESTQPGRHKEGYYPFWNYFNAEGGYYGYFWWGRERPGGKSDFLGLGNKGQYLYICPQKHLMIVRSGIEYGLNSMDWVRLFYEFAGKFK